MCEEQGQQAAGSRIVEVKAHVHVREIAPGLFAATSVMLPGVYAWARSADEAVADFLKSCAEMSAFAERTSPAAPCLLPAAELIQFPGERRFGTWPKAGSFDGSGSAA